MNTEQEKRHDMKQSKVEFIGRYISNSQKSRFRVESLKVNDKDITARQKPDQLDMTQTSFTKTMKQVFQMLKLYKRAKLTITIDEA